MAQKKITILDGHALLYRSYYAINKNLHAPDGSPTGAIFGFVQTIRNLIGQHRADVIIAAFDSHGPTFRHDFYADYKATRQPMPDDLRAQIPVCLDVCDAYGVPRVQVERYEADDLIATMTTQATAAGHRVLIVTGDKDLMQLVDDNVQILDIKSDEIIDAAGVERIKGVRPDQIADWLSLVGDSSDNIPGVSKIGPKAATELLREHQTLDAALDAARELVKAHQAAVEEYNAAMADYESKKAAGKKATKPKKPEKIKAIIENLAGAREQAAVSRELVALAYDAPIPFDINAMPSPKKDNAKLAELYRKTAIHDLMRDIEPDSSGHLPSIPNASDQPGLFDSPPPVGKEYRLVNTPDALKTFLKQLSQQKRFAFDTETTGTDSMRCSLVGMSFSWSPGQAWYLALMGPALFDPTLDLDSTLNAVRPYLEDERIEKIGQNILFDALVMRSHGVQLRGKYFDTMVADWALDPARRHNLDTLALRWLNYKKIPTESLIGKSGKTTMADAPIELVSEYACEDADTTFRIAEILAEQLKAEGLDKLFFEIEMPLLDVLEDMTWTGFAVETKELNALSEKLGADIRRMHDDIIKTAGFEFKVNSPAQLADALFNRLGFPVIKKSKKTQDASTDNETLEELMTRTDIPEQYRNLPQLIIDYRESAKLKSTYADALPLLVHPKTGRIHTHFNPIGTATGRLSSSDPNMQNIPVRTALGRIIRSAFRAGGSAHPDWLLLGFDYSQIELRILAHVSKDESLVNTFRTGGDIHRAVAAKLNGVSLDEVTSEQRSAAKAVNFGIIYGQTSFGLAASLKITRTAAAEIIDDYFRSHPGVGDCIDAILAETRKKKFVETLLGRRRFLPDIDSSDPTKRKFAERVAVNTRIQGTAADMIKIAMLDVSRHLKTSGSKAKMLLQIHDELIFESPRDEVEPLRDAIRQKMESAMSLDVPLVVDSHVANRWDELK